MCLCQESNLCVHTHKDQCHHLAKNHFPLSLLFALMASSIHPRELYSRPYNGRSLVHLENHPIFILHIKSIIVHPSIHPFIVPSTVTAPVHTSCISTHASVFLSQKHRSGSSQVVRRWCETQGRHEASTASAHWGTCFHIGKSEGVLGSYFDPVYFKKTRREWRGGKWYYCRGALSKYIRPHWPLSKPSSSLQFVFN